METKERTQMWRNAQLGIEYLQAFYVNHVFPRHTHEYYVISLILNGRLSFTHQRKKHYTPAGGLIFINPDAPHTGEAVDENGFEMFCIYPTKAHMQNAVFELTGRSCGFPYFRDVRVDQSWGASHVLAMRQTLTQATSALECESQFIWILIQLIKRYADIQFHERRSGQERDAVRQVREYIDAYFDRGFTLSQLAEYVSLSPYYLLRVFRNEVGIPPHVYLENVRIRQAQRLIKEGKSLAETALEVGFSSQSHMTYRFKQIIGVSPGYYAHQVKTSNLHFSLKESICT